MKVKSIHSIPILFASLAILTLGSCSSEKPGDASKRSGSPQTPAAYREALTSYAFERRSEFTAQFNAMHSEFAAQLREYEAKTPEASASDDIKAALADVRSADADFKNKLEALGTATAGTWKTARDNVTAAWDRLQAAFGRVHASTVAPSQGL